MKKASVGQSQWWKVVQSMADLVAAGYDEHELTENYVRTSLVEQGYSDDLITVATSWVEKAINSGTISECFAMLQNQSTGTRIVNPLEDICFSSSVWSRIKTCRQKGLISEEAMERMLEGARVIDTRDWEDDEVTNLLAEMLFTFNPSSSESEYIDMLRRCVPQFYC
ncbi:MAG: hypothetical protein HRU19_25340 [Pseudobacteriovorax sp.]|nr:hypothetical protein [Pseudobacteriovorax sp.]